MSEIDAIVLGLVITAVVYIMEELGIM